LNILSHTSPPFFFRGIDTPSLQAEILIDPFASLLVNPCAGVALATGPVPGACEIFEGPSATVASRRLTCHCFAASLFLGDGFFL